MYMYMADHSICDDYNTARTAGTLAFSLSSYSEREGGGSSSMD